MALTLELFPYQRDAFELFGKRGNILLAFEMGLGKTATAIACCEDLLDKRKIRTALIVVPGDLKYQWAQAIVKFTDVPVRTVKLKRQPVEIPALEACVIIDGLPEQRAKQFSLARKLKSEYVIIGMDSILTDYDDIASLNAGMCVLDEASKIKSMTSQRSLAVKTYLNYPYRMALTGTPIENRPDEVYSIMEWVDRTVLGRFDLFDHAYVTRNTSGSVIRYKNLDALHDKLSAAMCRKTWDDPEVALYLPKINYETWRVPMGQDVVPLYRVMAEELLNVYGVYSKGLNLKEAAAGIDRRGDKTSLGRMMSIHTCMEMLLVCPPAIIKSSVDYVSTQDSGSKYAFDFVSAGHDLNVSNVKKEFVEQQVKEILLRSAENKVMIFSRYREVVEMFSRAFADVGHVVYHGGMSNRDRAGAVNKFLEDPNTRIFISSHAGAYGVDLPVANYLINFDIPWGAGLARQINGRHVRTSSEHDVVYVIDVVIEGSLEERKLAMKAFKNALADAGVDGKTATGTLTNDVEELREHCIDFLAGTG
jgi:SNF2 family DNA or RNA helicase